MSITPEESVSLPSETTRKRTPCAVLPIVEAQVTETYLSLGVVPSQLSPSSAFIRTCEEEPFTVMVQSKA
ncbi:hypothetical protein I5677_03120 [Mobilitalea sibirica]|uniref:Uncharacterized protein n=1 Tax=Mobilitalea sibirica TaxID=1462919 RepID=A0A8J7H1B7_9FIRM|nr:hypothetical protein [Mobilitalea sibirica]MBH1939885.1 hypothetical protein [Mobilitalea sibirica]